MEKRRREKGEKEMRKKVKYREETLKLKLPLIAVLGL
jgi:hypothetical protein